jgi:hypothetical protein
MQKHWVWLFGKLSQAIGILVTNRGDVRNRVWVASKYLLQIPPQSVPPACRNDIIWVQHMLTRYPADAYGCSALDATYRRTRSVTAAKIAERIWHVYHVYETALESENSA